MSLSDLRFMEKNYITVKKQNYSENAITSLQNKNIINILASIFIFCFYNFT